MADKLEDVLRDDILVARVREARRQIALAPTRDRSGRPVVEYLEDSSMSVEYFKMKNSVFFSMIEKEEKATTPKLKDGESKVSSEKNGPEEKLKLFNISAVNQDEFILNSVSVRQYKSVREQDQECQERLSRD